MTNGLKCTETRVTDCSITVSWSAYNGDGMNEQKDELKEYDF